MTDEWKDKVIDGVKWVHNFMDFVVAERSQIYGTLIHLFLLLQTESIILPDRETLIEYGEKYYVLFAPNEEGIWEASIKERESNESKNDLLD